MSMSILSHFPTNHTFRPPKLQIRYGIVLTLQNRHAKVLQQSLLEIFNRIEAVKEEHDKLDNNNKFLQKYIGDLMSTSKITSTGASGRKK